MVTTQTYKIKPLSSLSQTAFKALCQSTHLYGRRLVLEWAEEDESISTLRQKTAQHYHEGTGKGCSKGLCTFCQE